MTCCIHAPDFDALVRKLYAKHGLSASAATKHPGTIAERHAVQRLYTIRPARDRYCATPKAQADV